MANNFKVQDGIDIPGAINLSGGITWTGNGAQIYEDTALVLSSSNAGVGIVANDSIQLTTDGNAVTWTFDSSGNLTLPANGDIKDSNGNSVLGGGSTPGISNGTFSTLPDFLDFYSGTKIKAGQNEQGVFFSGNANGGISYPVRTNFSIPGNVKSVITVDMVVNSECSDFSLCVFEDGVQPMWSWNTDPTRLAAHYNCTQPQLKGINNGVVEPVWNIPGNGTYRVRYTYDPNNSPNMTLETLDTGDNVLNTITVDDTLNTSNDYYIGFSADQDDKNLRTYIKNLNIVIDNGPTYTDSLMLASGSGATDQISSGQYNVTVNSSGVISMTTDRGRLEFGALPEPGGPSHFHIMRAAGQDGSGGMDLFFGDDFNYVRQRPAQYNQDPAFGVEIGANDNNGGNQQVWRFGTDGRLWLPSGATGDTSYSTIRTDGAFLNLDVQYGSLNNVYGGARVGTNGTTPLDIVTDFTGAHNTWRFGTDGDLVLPAGKTIRDTAGTDLLAANTSGLLPPHKGFRAHYGRMYNNGGDNNGPINKLVIYRDTVTPASAIDTSTESDDFQVTGLTGSDVVAMLVVVSDGTDWQNPTPTATLKTFVEAVIDNVILNGGVEGDVNSIDDMKANFYANFSSFNTIIPNVKTALEFFSNPNNPQYNLSNVTYNGSTGDGANFYSMEYNFDNSRFQLSSWGQNAPAGYTVGDTFTILGINITDNDTGNPFVSPDNDTTITVVSVDGSGYINETSIATGIPVPSTPDPIWPDHSINDGGNDEYDGANAIHTNYATNISYNSGNAVYGTSDFGGGEYVVTYENGIFGVFATNAGIDVIGTSGDNGGYGNDSSSSGFDGDGVADTGGLFGEVAAESPVIASWTNPNSHVWRIETYNGGYSGYYDGGNYDAKWFDVANSVSGAGNFRGAIIEYHAFVNNRGTMVGTIHMSMDNNTGESVTHTEHMSGGGDMSKMSLWTTNNERGQLYFKRIDGSSENLMIQWTAKIFYGQENYC